MENKTLVFSIALNGYQWMYRKQLKSHRQYATKHQYVHQAITRPFLTTLGVECCWLKLTLMREALLCGYDTVLFLDADTQVNDNCPALNQITQGNKYIYMAKGYSNRFNSGVVLVKNNIKTMHWLNQIIDARHHTVKKENDVGWGENGHIIEMSKGLSCVAELDQRWNNTYDYNLNDYIRHHNCGPMRTRFIYKIFHRAIFFLSARFQALLNFSNRFNNKPDTDLLTHETTTILSIYSDVFPKPVSQLAK
jgi:hypothetical protein